MNRLSNMTRFGFNQESLFFGGILFGIDWGMIGCPDRTLVQHLSLSWYSRVGCSGCQLNSCDPVLGYQLSTGWCFGKQLWIWLWDRNEGNLKIKGNHCCVRPNLWPEAMTSKTTPWSILGAKTTKPKIYVWKDPKCGLKFKCWEVSGSKMNMGQLVEGAFDVLRMSLHTTNEMTCGWKYVTVTTKPIKIHPSRKQ